MNASSLSPLAFEGDVTVLAVISTGRASSWAVLRVADSNGEMARIVGSSLGLFATPGRRLHVTGRWHDDSRYGLQVKVARTEASFITRHKDDPHSFLTGAPHIGAKRAQLLVDEHGPTAVLRKIDEDPVGAFRALGLPIKHRAAAVKWWRNHQ